MAEIKQTILTEDEFDKRFTVINGPDDGWYHSDFEDVKKKKYDPAQIWTAVDTDEGSAVCSGLHLVNRFAYVVTEEHVPDDEIIVVEMPDAYPEECKTCRNRIRKDDKGTWVDETEGDVCMDNDGEDGAHEPEEEPYDEGYYYSGTGEHSNDDSYIEYLNNH